MRLLQLVLATTILTELTACGGTAEYPTSAATGENPVLPPPDTSWIPAVQVPPATGWPEGAEPIAADGIAVTAFASGLDHPRWIYVLPNGDVLVAETNAPPKPEDMRGIKGWFMKRMLQRAGATGPSANRITLLRDTDGDGTVDVRTAFLEGLNSPFGMVLVGNDLYVANTDALVRFPYQRGQTQITAPGTTVVELPAGPINRHWTKNVVASADGSKLSVSVGSNSDHGENGLDNEEGRAALWEVNPATGDHRILASGLRNPVGMALEPETGVLWTSVNGRDELGNDVPPDYLTSVRDGGFYGWPYSYFGQNLDPRVQPQRPDLVARAITPDYALGPHTASLGLASSQDTTLPEQFRDGMFVGQHGSWNRDPPSGYKVIFVPFRNGKPAGQPRDVLTGFLDHEGNALGRPVGVAVDGQGALLVADDVGDIIWRVTASPDQQ